MGVADVDASVFILTTGNVSRQYVNAKIGSTDVTAWTSDSQMDLSRPESRSVLHRMEFDQT